MGDRPLSDQEMATPINTILGKIKLNQKNEEVFLKPLSTKVAKVSRSYASKKGLRLVVEPIDTPSLNGDETRGDRGLAASSCCEMNETDSFTTEDSINLANPTTTQQAQTTTTSTTATSEFMSSIDHQIKKPEGSKSKKNKKTEKVNLFTEHTGPEWHKVSNKIVTKPIISTNLPKVYKNLPVFDKPRNNADWKSFQDRSQRKYLGLPDDEYDKVNEFCSADMPLSDREMEMSSCRPTQGLLSASMALREEEHGLVVIPDRPQRNTLKKLQTRLKDDIAHVFARKLKYRGVRMLPLQNPEKAPEPDDLPPDLEPGSELLYRVRVYRPFSFSAQGPRNTHEVRGRHSVFNCDVVILGRQRLSELRDRIVCRNDLDLRLDMSEQPSLPPPATAKDSFPSNFMFISNVFYIDSRAHCHDISGVVRRFARERGLGAFPVRDMCQVNVRDLHVRLAYPEVYVHQGNCEHIFQFSEIRLLSCRDPLHLSNYPCHTTVSQHQILYCNSCAEFAAKWIVTASKRVPFDPAFFCETCFYSYMYIGNKKVEDFKAYLYKGNEINMLRPNADVGQSSEDAGADKVHDQVHITF